MSAGDNLGNQFWGKGLDVLFPEGSHPHRDAPWSMAGKRKDRKEYDPDVVRQGLSEPPTVQQVDPRNLRATQPKITRSGVEYYANSDDYQRTGRTYADQSNAGNQVPFVYRREDGQDLLLSGHHRAAAALVKGEPLEAIVKEGPWGPPRNIR